MKSPHWRLFPKYATLIIALVGGVLIVSGAVSLLFSWREISGHLVALQAEKAQGAATRIEQYILDIEHQLGWTAFPRMDALSDPVEQRRIEYLKLLRQVPAVTELVWIGPDGRERLRVSRLAMDAVAAGTDLSNDPAVTTVKGGKTYFGPVNFRKGTEPYMTIARPAGGDGGVTMADVNLKFVWDVVSRLKIGVAGVAYVVDAGGTLIAHPDISLVLKKTDLRALPQVAALDRPDSAVTEARNLAGDEVFAAHARIPTLRWAVLAETPRSEAFAPLYDSLIRLGLLLVAALGVAAAASFFLARALVRPIRALQQGAARFGAGQLDERIAVTSGDELEGLAEQFNQMGAALQASYAGLERKVEERTSELSETLAQQTALGEVLRVISQSPTDVAPVFEAILDSAHRLFGSPMAAVFRYDGQLVHLVAQRNWSEEGIAQAARFYPGPPSPQRLIGRVILRRETVVIEDCQLDPDYDRATAAAAPWRSLIGVPLLREGAPLGVLSLAWPEPGPVPQRQVELLQTFADQAVIAIENVRLFNETKEALEKQTATSEILQAISSSPTSTAPVFEAIAHRSMRLCAADYGFVFTFDGQWIRLGFQLGVSTEGTQAIASHFPMRPDGNSVTARTIASGDVVNVADVLAEPGYQLTGAARAAQYRAALSVPMKRQGQVVGAITVARVGVGDFPAREVDLLKTFADQAVIAIENVRLFNETKEALEQQTAISDILRAISESPADVKPVLDAIADRAARLCDAASASIYLTEGDQLRHVASQGRLADQSASIDLLPINRHSTSGRAVLERTTIQVADLLAEADQYPIGQEIAKRIGHRSLVVTPLFREGQPFGTILLRRQEVRPFSEREVALLRTFGDQAAIALENTRLFHEIQDKSRQLEAANRHKSEFLANMSHELRTPLNAIIGFSEVLTEQMFGELNDKQMEYLRDIHSSGQHLLTLINDVLDLSKIEAGKMELDLSCFDLGLLLEHSTTLVRERAQRHGLTLQLDIGDGLDEWVADARKVKQAVVNLLSNAVKFTPNGGTVTVRAHQIDRGDGHAGGWAEVQVIDTGIGIKPKDQALVFEEFRQASGDVLRKSEGTGLGLALVKRFVELHGGQVVLQSAPGAGSTFTITLPALNAELQATRDE